MTTERTRLGQEVEAALGEVVAHVRGEVELPCRIVVEPSAEHILGSFYDYLCWLAKFPAKLASYRRKKCYKAGSSPR